MKTSTLTLIGIAFSGVGVGMNVWSQSWLCCFWALNSLLWAFLAFRLSKKGGD